MLCSCVPMFTCMDIFLVVLGNQDKCCLLIAKTVKLFPLRPLVKITFKPQITFRFHQKTVCINWNLNNKNSFERPLQGCEWSPAHLNTLQSHSHCSSKVKNEQSHKRQKVRVKLLPFSISSSKPARSIHTSEVEKAPWNCSWLFFETSFFYYPFKATKENSIDFSFNNMIFNLQTQSAIPWLAAQSQVHWWKSPSCYWIISLISIIQSKDFLFYLGYCYTWVHYLCFGPQQENNELQTCSSEHFTQAKRS